MASLIRLVPDDLKVAMQVFTERAEQLNGLHRQMESHLDRLRSGGWTGKGAGNFYAEMQNLVSPALLRLIKALHDSTQSTQTLINILQQAEEEAAMLFFGEGDFEEAGSGVGVGYAEYVKNGGEMPVRYKPAGAGGGGGGGNREELDTLTGDQASALTRELNDRVGRFSSRLDDMANGILNEITVGFALEEMVKSIFASVSNTFNLGVSAGFAKATGDLKGGIAGWFAAHFLGQMAEGIVEYLENIGETGNPINIGDGRDTIPEIARSRALGMVDLINQIIIQEVGRDAILTHANFAEIGNAIDGALASNPNAAISGEIYTNERGETYARITADGQEIYNKPVTAEAARVIDETFDRYGPNYTSQNSLSQGINSYMESNWSGGANISETIRNIMRDPEMQAIVERINQGEAIAPSEILPILERYPVVMPAPLPEAPIAPAQPEAVGTPGAPTDTPPNITPEVTPGAPSTQTPPLQPTLTPTPPAP
jgi:WXG100 family type VII secretion target